MAADVTAIAAAATSAWLCGRAAGLLETRAMAKWTKHDMEFLGGRRLRRLRQFAWSRALVRETVLTPADLILPLFVIEGTERADARSRRCRGSSG